MNPVKQTDSNNIAAKCIPSWQKKRYVLQYMQNNSTV